jgi:hypothetical protein
MLPIQTGFLTIVFEVLISLGKGYKPGTILAIDDGQMNRINIKNEAFSLNSF